MVKEGHVVLQKMMNYPWRVMAHREDNNRNQDLGCFCLPSSRKEEIAKSFRRHIDMPDHGQVEEEEQGHGEDELVEDDVHPEVVLGISLCLRPCMHLVKD